MIDLGTEYRLNFIPWQIFFFFKFSQNTTFLDEKQQGSLLQWQLCSSHSHPLWSIIQQYIFQYQFYNHHPLLPSMIYSSTIYSLISTLHNNTLPPSMIYSLAIQSSMVTLKNPEINTDFNSLKKIEHLLMQTCII